MRDFEFKEELYFVNEVVNFFESIKVVKTFLKAPENEGLSVYVGNDKKLRSGLLYKNILDMLTMRLIDSTRDSHAEGHLSVDEKDIAMLLPALNVIIDLELPIALLPIVEYNHRVYQCETQMMRIRLNGYNDFLVDEIDFINELDMMMTRGINNDTPYRFGVYSIQVSPTIYHPENFSPTKTLMIRIFKYRI